MNPTSACPTTPDALNDVPPRDLEAEVGVLGSFILDPAGTAALLESLSPGEFYSRRYRLIFEALNSLHARRVKPDLVTLRQELEVRGTLDDAGGAIKLTEIIEGVPSAANVEEYVRLVKAAAKRRAVQAVARKALRQSEQPGSSAERVAADLQASMAGLAADGDSGVDIRRFPCTDAGNGELIAALFGDRLRWDWRRGRWLLWDGQHWTGDDDGEVRRLALQASRERQTTALGLGDSALKKQHVNFGIASENRTRLDAALEAAKSTRPVSDAGDGWDAEAWLLGVANGVADLRAGTLRPGRPEDKITLVSPVPFDPDARAPRWERFLLEVFQDDIDLATFVQTAAGYSLTGDVREQCWFMLYGTGANGKSTFLEVLRAVFGPYGHNAPFSAFEQGRGGQTASNDLAALAGRRLVTASEALENSRFNEPRLKSLSGGDVVSARFLYREYFQFRPTCKLWLSANHRPRVMDESRGFWRRVRLVPFQAHFDGEAADKDLVKTLTAEAAGILTWAVHGCLAWQEGGGLWPCEAVTAATRDYEAASDPLADFLMAACVSGEGLTVTAADLYRAYTTWGDSEGMPVRERLSRQAFGRRIGEKYSRGFTSSKRVLYQGLGLLADESGVGAGGYDPHFHKIP